MVSKIGLRRPCSRASQRFDLPSIPIRLPRLWMILLVLAVPFIGICAIFFETLERSGTAGAIIADTLMPATFIGYMVLLYRLKQHRI